jgi:hypothetical protein
MKRIIRRALVAGAVGFIGLQFIPVAQLPAREGGSNPQNPMLQAGLPPHLADKMYQACGNCHTNVTEWPWYSRIAPVSWLMARDVERARKTLNFSEWEHRYKEKPAVAASMLLTACESIRKGRMPLSKYVLLHPEAKLKPSEAEEFCGWSKEQARLLILQHRRKATAAN